MSDEPVIATDPLAVSRRLFFVSTLNLLIAPVLVVVTFFVAGGGHGPVQPFFVALGYSAVAYGAMIYGVVTGFLRSNPRCARPTWLYWFACYLSSPIVLGLAAWAALSYATR